MEHGARRQACHRRGVTRQLAEAKRPLKGLQPAQPCRVHDFGMARDDAGVYEGAVHVDATIAAGRLTARLTPHRGHALVVHAQHEVRLDVTLFDTTGTALAMFRPLQERFPSAGEGALGPGMSTEVTFDVPPNATAAELRIRRVTKDDGKLVQELARARVERD